MITLSVFNRYFGHEFGQKPLETLTNAKNEIIQNGSPDLTKEERETLGNSLINLYKDYEELSDKVGLLEGSIEDKLRKNELSESQTKDLFKWMSENTASAHLMSVDGVSYDEAYIEVFHTSKNIDEFKEKYLELQQKYLADFKNINSSQGTPKEDVNLSQKNQEEQENKLFKPIEGKSQNTQTYTREDIVKDFFLNFLEAQKMKGADILELLEKLHGANSKVDIKA